MPKNPKKFRDFREKLDERFYGQSYTRTSALNPQQEIDGIDTHFRVSEIQHPEILQKVNSYIGTITGHPFINPMTPLSNLQYKLQLVGLSFVIPHNLFQESSGTVSLPISKWGNITGVDLKGNFVKNDDGFDNPMVLKINYSTKAGMIYFDQAAIQPA